MAESVEYNLFARFRFMNQPGVGQMKQTGGAFASLHKNAKMARAGVSQMGRGFRTLGMYGAGAIAVLGSVVKTGAKFYQQMSVVRSVTAMTGEEFKALRKQALHLGATTSFTSTQAAQGMENLARAGFSYGEIVKAIQPTLKMAEADSMDLASAASIVSNTIRQFGMRGAEAGKVADLLAYASANSNTNITALGESLNYVGEIAKRSNQTVESTIGTLGLLANVGIKGSMAGTTLKNAIMKLTKGSEAAVKLFGGKKGLRQALTDSTGKMRPMNVVIGKAIQKLKGIKNDADRAAAAFGVFGIRGSGALGAIKSAKPEHIAKLITDIGTASKGTAEKMAATRLDNVAGQWTLFKSALDNVKVAIFEVFQGGISRVMPDVVGWTSKFGNAIRMVNEGASESAVIKKYGKVIADIIFGVKEGVQEAWVVLKQMGKTVLGVFQTFSSGSKMTRKDVIKLVAKIGGLVVMLTPIAGILATIGIAAGAMFNVFSGGFKVLNALTSRWGLALGAFVLVMSGGQKKGESFFQTMTRGLKNTIALANKLLWPFKMLAKHLGTIPALMAGIAAYKGGKALLGRVGGALSRSRNPLARMLGGITGAAGRQGMPVYVTNFGEMPSGGMGGLPGMGGGLPGAAGKMGFLGRLARFGGMTGVSTAGLFTGGSVVSTSGGATAGAAGLAGTIGTTTMALGGFAAALAPAVAGLHEMGKAYDPAFQAKYRDKMLAGYRKQQREARMKQESEDKKRIALGMGPKFMSLEYSKNESWQQYHLRKKIKQTGVHLGHADVLKRGFAAARGGDVWRAKGALAAVGGEKFAKTFAQMSEYDLKLYGLNKEMIDVLKAINKASSGTIDAISRGWSTTINLDGKQIAIVTAQHRQTTKERSGRPVEAGARSRAARTGNP